MIPVLDKRKLVLGVTGSISCYKALDLASTLTQAGAIVDVIMTGSATQFISPIAFSSITHRPTVTDLFNPHSKSSIEHVSLAQEADLIIVAPCTANTIGKIAHGLCDDALTTTILATKAPIIIAPAMDGQMYQNIATQENLKKLSSRGIIVLEPEEGYLASGITGMGRLIDNSKLMGHIRTLIGQSGDLAGRVIAVTSGGTEEPIDPVRMITNRSSGKTGHAIAEASRDRGARTILITAPTELPDPIGIDVIKASTTMEMLEAVNKVSNQIDVLIMVAAVSDFRPTMPSNEKLKKGSKSITLKLSPNPDILTEITGDFVKVGFAAESHNLLNFARKKLISKDLDLIIANDISKPNSGFGSDINNVIIIDRNNKTEYLPSMLKTSIAHHILDRIALILKIKPA
jgi:phosphopantothenoylcysteine decarboxylase/phosphopantothenate--cysteine ligase